MFMRRVIQIFLMACTKNVLHHVDLFWVGEFPKYLVLIIFERKMSVFPNIYWQYCFGNQYTYIKSAMERKCKFHFAHVES